MAKRGAPRKHDRPAIVAEVCRLIRGGELVKNACKTVGITPDQVRDWCGTDQELSALYARARDEQAHAIAEQAIAIADEKCASIVEAQRNRLRVDTRKWLASKIAPRYYGERIEQAHTGSVAVEHVWKFGDRTVTF